MEQAYDVVTPPVAEAEENLRKAVAELDETVMHVVNRFTYVARPSNPPAQTNEGYPQDSQPATTSGLVADFNSLTKRVTGITNLLIDLLNRAEV